MQKIIDEVFDSRNDVNKYFIAYDAMDRYLESPKVNPVWLANALIKVLEGLPITEIYDGEIYERRYAVTKSDIQSTIEMIRKKVA